MSTLLYTLVFLSVMPTIISSDGDSKWQRKQAPLMTRWAKEVTPQQVHPEYPRPQLVREDWLNLNGLWEFETASKNATLPSGKTLQRRILVPFAVESALSSIMEKHKYIWYRRQFELPPSWSDRKILLHFGAADWHTTIFVNSKEAGQHKGGYDAFSFDITPFLKQSGAQELIVKVYDPTDDGVYPRGKQVDEPGGIFYTSVTGIWQTVWLEPLPELHISDVHIETEIRPKKVSVIVNSSAANEKNSVRISVLDGDNILGKADGVVAQQVEIAIPDARLWTPEDPKLYDLKIELLQNSKVVDVVKSYFGVRKISLGKDEHGITRILLNDKILFQIGPLDQGYWPDGLYTAPTDEALRYDIEIAKELGFNMIRKHTKVEPQRWYYWCDKLGMLVWQDMPSVNPKDFEKKRSKESETQFETELKEMIVELQNHPSIIMWVVFNEGWGQYDTERLTRWVKSIDPTRLVNNASGWTDKRIGDIIDIHKYPGPGSPLPESKRAAVLGEFGGLGLPIEGHTWTDENWGYQNLKSKTELRNRYEQLFDEVWKLKNNPGLSAAVYTQTTDVETETNGLMTYDRKIIKLDPEEARALHSDQMVSPAAIVPNEALFLENTQIKIANRKGESIRYTLDGSEPNLQSTLYTGPFTLFESATVKARSIATNSKMSGTTSAKFTKTTLRKSETPGQSLKQGLNYAYFEGQWNLTPDFDTLKAVQAGITDKFDLSRKHRDDLIGFKFDGFIKIQKPGVYTFYTESDDGSKLFIGDQLVVDNDGFHGMTEKSGQIALDSGWHPIKVTFFEGLNDHGLIVRYECPGAKKQEIPASVLFH